MEALWVEPSSYTLMEPKWSKTLALSLVLHLAVFSIILFVPEQMPTRRIRGAIYEVNLVELPGGGRPAVKRSSKAKTTNGRSVLKEAAPARRISRPKEKEKPVVIAKRVVEGKSRKPEKLKVSPAKLINQALTRIEKKVKAEEKDPARHLDQAVSRIEKKVKAEEKDPARHLDQAVSRIEKKVKAEEKDSVEQAISNLEARGGGVPGRGFPGGDADIGVTFRMYQMEVEDRIKGNWSYPVALTSPKSRKDLEAIVMVKVKNDGTILKFWISKRSSNVVFDQSALKAVERSDPLPPFPEGYRKTFDEIEINFNLRDLEAY